ncbi:ATP-binding cassette domain-containing protein [Vagococcus acidifermentans]|uniref:Multidrug ABC transporter ATP-binding protein n=1 Tax=Vagococcus acidifermentans TaxID=564710 RepID=A0A430ANE9_9ENTE|nr:ABC transporter ATP-binding protein [Vagococcus acidifermentans]RSU09631.1 multidrug ABC transporter ATP-binding protein [Vagococcus acidifermentans]
MDITIEQLKKHYGVFEALTVSSLTFESGKAYGVIGPNGAGKTTLFKCMTNIIVDYDGHIFYDGISPKEQPDVLLQIGIVLDDMSVYKNRSGWFNIAYFAGLRGGFDRGKALDLAAELDIADVLNSPVTHYSYGMTKKLILLIALLHEPAVLILDEPFRGLDMETVSWFKNYLRQLRDNGMSLIISSHVKNDIEELCQEVFVLKKGKVVKHLDFASVEGKEIRDIRTSDFSQFLSILDDVNLYYQELAGEVIRVNIADERWAQVNSQLRERDIDIYEMSVVNILDNLLN